MTTLQSINASASPEVQMNDNFETVSAAGIFAKKQTTTTGLTWGYYGGLYNGNTVADGTVTLSNNATNYLVVLRSTGVVSVSTATTHSTDALYARLYKVTTVSGAVTAVVDERWEANGLMFNASGASGTVTSVDASGGVETVSGSAITTSGTVRGAMGVNAQTGTTYTYVTGDRGKLVTHSNAAAIAGTLPQAGTTGFENKWYMLVQNRGAGTLTITPTTSTIDGSATLALTTGQGCIIASDGTNYYTTRGVGGSGSGSVTHTGGALTANAVVLGAGTDDTKVVAGITTDGTSALNLGAAGASVGKVVLANATSGTITVQPPTGALGTVTLTLPAATDTLVGKATTDTLTNKTLTSPTMTAPVLGTPASGTLTNCTGLPGASLTGAYTAAGLTLATSRLLGRTTASSGAAEEITVGTGLSLSAGTLTATGGGSTQGKQSIWIPAGAMIPRASSGAEPLTPVAGSTDQPDIHTIDFDGNGATKEKIQFDYAMPKKWNGGTVTFKPYWSHTGAATNFATVWGLQGRAFADAGALAASYGTAQTSTDTGGTNGSIYIGPESSAITIAGSPAGEQYVSFQLYRDPADAGDTMVTDARLHGIMLYITTNADTDA